MHIIVYHLDLMSQVCIQHSIISMVIILGHPNTHHLPSFHCFKEITSAMLIFWVDDSLLVGDFPVLCGMV